MLDNPCKDWEGHIFTMGGLDYYIEKATVIDGGVNIECVFIQYDTLSRWERFIVRFWKLMQWRLLKCHRKARAAGKLHKLVSKPGSEPDATAMEDEMREFDDYPGEHGT